MKPFCRRLLYFFNVCLKGIWVEKMVAFFVFRGPCVFFATKRCGPTCIDFCCIRQCCTDWGYNGTPQIHAGKKKGAGNVSIHFIPGHCLHTALELAGHTSHRHCGGGHNQFVSWPPVSESSLSSA